MNILNKFLIAIIFVLILSCSSNEEVFVPMDKISDQGKILSIDDLKSTGFKKSNEYNVEELPGASSAFYGFMKNELGDPEDYSNVKINFVKDRPGHDLRYALNSKKIEKQLKWKSKVKIREGLEKTFLWYFKNKMYYKFISKKDITLRLGKK